MTETDDHSSAMKAAQTTSADGSSQEQIPARRDADEKLRALTAEYEAKMDEVADLITRVRHEINNPLTGVLGQAQLLLREDLPERAKKRAETIEALALRIRDIVAQLREVQKISRS
ncbi:MAG: histidine kinase dimerization/phospho-acceptor domain-containing protein [Pyrinomonadaceae bacterium]